LDLVSPYGYRCSLDTLKLPLAQNANASPDGLWIKIAENTADCQAKLETEIQQVFSGNPCILGGGSVSAEKPIYAWQPSDKRFHFFDSNEIGQCFAERDIKKILIMGDSQARTLYGTLPLLLGDVDLGPGYADELKEKLKSNSEGNGGKVSDEREKGESDNRIRFHNQIVKLLAKCNSEV